MTIPLINGFDLVLGYGAYKKYAGFLNKFIRFDTLMVAIQYFSFVLINRPYMGVGRNMAYTKTLFKSVDGFSSHIDSASGDDDLFVQSVVRSAKVFPMIDSHAFTLSEPKLTWRSFYSQKARHITTSSAYKWFHKILLTGFAGSHIVFYLLVCNFLFASNALPLILIYMITIIPAWVIFYRLSRKFNESDLAKWFPILDFIYFIYMLVLFPALIFKKKTW